MSTKYINKQSHASTLAFFRLAFGLMMLSSLIVLRVLGGLKIYIDPQFHFTYYGFQWVKPWEIIPIYFYYSCHRCTICCARL
jgi:hypothetical protein